MQRSALFDCAVWLVGSVALAGVVFLPPQSLALAFVLGGNVRFFSCPQEAQGVLVGASRRANTLAARPLFADVDVPLATSDCSSALELHASVDEASVLGELAAAADLNSAEFEDLKELRRASPFALPLPSFVVESVQSALLQSDPEGGVAFSRDRPGMSLRQIAYHFARHHATYVRTLNAITRHAPLGTALANAAGQHFNHSFFWEGLTARSSAGGDAERSSPLNPHGELIRLLRESFGSFEGFFEAFKKKSVGGASSDFSSLSPRAVPP